MKPKCEPNRPTWSQKRTEGSQNGAQRVPKVDQNASKDRCSEKVVKMMLKWSHRLMLVGKVLGDIFRKTMQNSRSKDYGHV